MKLIDHQYLATPFYGARKIAAWLKSQGQRVNRKRVRRLMRLMGLKAIYRRPRTSKPAPGHKIYPYLLSDLKITRTCDQFEDFVLPDDDRSALQMFDGHQKPRRRTR